MGMGRPIRIVAQAKKAKKLENKLEVLCGGYLARSAALEKQLVELNEAQLEGLYDLGCFRS